MSPASCPGRGAALLQRCSADPGPTHGDYCWTPDQQRTTSKTRVNALMSSGERTWRGHSMSDVVLEKVSRHFGDFIAVNDVDLRVAQGEFVTLLGPSGCGKTTTLRMVAGLEQNTGGRISIDNEVVSDAASRVFVPSERRRLGMVFQSYAIWPHMTVFENVAYPLRVRRRPAEEIRDRVLKTLRLVEMESFAERPAPALSGGQQQRVAIAR